MSLHTPAMHTPTLPHVPAWVVNTVLILVALVLAVALLLALGALTPTSQTAQTWSDAEVQAAHQDYRAGERALPLVFSDAQTRNAWNDYRAGERTLP